MVNADEPHADSLLDETTQMAPAVGDDTMPHLLHQGSAIPPFTKEGRDGRRMSVPVPVPVPIPIPIPIRSLLRLSVGAQNRPVIGA